MVIIMPWFDRFDKYKQVNSVQLQVKGFLLKTK